MDFPFALVDAFVTDRAFSGNPAGVVFLQEWLPAEVMQAIGSEINQAETAFLVPEKDVIGLRWFTPTVEVELCGHATLASATALQNWKFDVPAGGFRFDSASGELNCAPGDGGTWNLNFPIATVESCALPSALTEVSAQAKWTGHYQMDWLAELESEQAVIRFVPDLSAIFDAGRRGLVITARTSESEFVYRFFAPQSGVDEDHATGSAQTGLVPYWSENGMEGVLSSRQLSKRRAEFASRVDGERVLIGGRSRVIVSGNLVLPN